MNDEAPNEKPAFRVIDRRSVGFRGERLQPIVPSGAPVVRGPDLLEAIDDSFRYFRAQLDHLTASAPSGPIREILHGFVTSTYELFGGTLLPLAEQRPKQHLLPAAVVSRALVEGLGNVFALVQDPEEASQIFQLDNYWHMRRIQEYRKRRFPGRPGIATGEQTLVKLASALGLSAADVADDPRKHMHDWPTPGRLIKSKAPPRLAGERRAVFIEVYGHWYELLSALAHHKLAALQLVTFSDEMDETSFLMAKSRTVALAFTVTLCVLAEVEAFFELEACTPLRVAWERALSAHELIRTVYGQRYARLLGMPLLAASPPGTGKP